MEVYQIDIKHLEKISDSIEFWRDFLAKERFEYAMKYRRYEDRLRSVGAGLIMSYGLKKRGIKIKTEKEPDGIPYTDLIGFGENQKPYLKTGKNVFFNISHSGQYVVGVFGDSECGVDIEKDNENVVFLKKYYSEKEWEYVQRNQGKNATRLWTLKESYIKTTGDGISKKMPEIDIGQLEKKDIYENTDISTKNYLNSFSQVIGGKEYCFSELAIFDGYSLSVCSTTMCSTTMCSTIMCNTVPIKKLNIDKYFKR